MPRQRLVDRPIDKKISIPTSIVHKVEALNIDPFTGKVRYAALSVLVTRLLRKWLEEQPQETQEEQPHGSQ